VDAGTKADEIALLLEEAIVAGELAPVGRDAGQRAAAGPAEAEPLRALDATRATDRQRSTILWSGLTA